VKCVQQGHKIRNQLKPVKSEQRIWMSSVERREARGTRQINLGNDSAKERTLWVARIKVAPQLNEASEIKVYNLTTAMRMMLMTMSTMRNALKVHPNSAGPPTTHRHSSRKIPTQKMETKAEKDGNAAFILSPFSFFRPPSSFFQRVFRLHVLNICQPFLYFPLAFVAKLDSHLDTHRSATS